MNPGGLSVESSAVAPATPVAQTRPFAWSLRREVWENRSVYLAPMFVGAFVLVGFVISTIGMPHRRRAALQLAPDAQRMTIGAPYMAAGAILMVTAVVVALFYCLDALHGERRDRSILFWKSLPVSDRTTVLAKAGIPAIVLPSITFVVLLVARFLMLIWTSIVLLPSGLSGTTWTRYNFVEHTVILLYLTVAMVLWHAPVYGWLLMISAWSRRARFLWALSPLAICIMEMMAFQTTSFLQFIKYRLMGFGGEAFTPAAKGNIWSLTQVTPLHFLATPGLWLGLLFAAVFLVASVRLRRNREPI